MALSVEEVEMLRRSHAMAPLRPDDVSQLLDSCAELAAERRELIRVLHQLRHVPGGATGIERYGDDRRFTDPAAAAHCHVARSRRSRLREGS